MCKQVIVARMLEHIKIFADASYLLRQTDLRFTSEVGCQYPSLLLNSNKAS
jgi:hypothetical protein